MGFGTFKGDVVAKWLRHRGDDRNMELQQDFSYIDPGGKTWLAARGRVVNGASIPSALWTTIGPPYVGDYRRASVVHDVACEDRAEPHEVVHLMFYNAMRADGVGWVKANTMYQAVKRFGPRWSRAGAALQPKSRPTDEAVLRFASAVEQAAREIDEGQGLDAVERRAEEIILATRAGPPRNKKETTRRKKSRGKQLSRVQKVTRHRAATTASTSGPAFRVEHLHASVRKQLAGACPLHSFRCDTVEMLSRTQEFLSHAGADTASASADSESDLSKSDRLLLVDQALVLLEQNYVHLQLKEAMHAINPDQSLRLLREQILQSREGQWGDSLEFHRRLLAIFHSNRDLHTNYFLPEPFAAQTAFLPFLVEDFFEAGDPQRRFLVTRVFSGFSQPPFGPGVEILRWNGIPIERAVEINGDRFAGSNLDARRARGLETLTVRSLIQSLPPEEDFVLVEYRMPDGSAHELRTDWQLFTLDTSDSAALGEMEFESAVAQGIDLEQAIVRLAKKVLFAPDVVAQAKRMSRRKSPAKGQGLDSLMPDVLEARPVTTSGGEYAYVRIRTFSVGSADRFVDEFVRLVQQLPHDGLIIDVRGNGGGLILAGEQLLQTLTPASIEPTLFQLRNTPLNRRLVEANAFLAPWRESMRWAVSTGATYSQGFPITDPEKANEIGQIYHGPVVLITDALCYSTTDIFAAGFQDHGIGPIMGTDGNTGAGGANVWDHRLLSQLLDTNDSPYRPLPASTAMRVSMRRTIRVGKSNGTVLEDLGVIPDIAYRMTRDDLLHENVDLVETAGSLLNELPTRRLTASLEVDAEGDEVQVALDTLGVDRVDFYDDARPVGTVDVDDGVTDVAVGPVRSQRLVVRGFLGGSLVAARRLELPDE